MRITSLEVARGEQEHHMRQAMRALYTQRTASGTFDDVAGEVLLSDRTLELTDGVLHAIEAARLKTVAVHWSEYAAGALRLKAPTVTELLHELRTIRDGLRRAAFAGSGDEDVPEPKA